MKKTNSTFRILAKDHLLDNDTWKTCINNNDLIIGPSGSGKTRNYVKPNILQANESMVIADTKGNLRHEFAPYLKKKGYVVYDLDLIDVAHSPCGYNPLDFIHYDASTDSYSQSDIVAFSNIVCSVQHKDEPFWDNAARQYLTCLLAYIFECLPKEEHTMAIAGKLFRMMNTEALDLMFTELAALKPDCYAVELYESILSNRVADRMDSSIRGILAERLSKFTFDGCENFYNSKHKLTLADIGKRKTAVFVTISDNDRSRDPLANLFYTQTMQALIQSADRDYADCRLAVPTRFILDDFATNTVIPDFDNLISVVRSREIYFSLIIQSLSQLNKLYNEYSKSTIINNCDNWLYLGGQDVDTATYLSKKANKTVANILGMDLNDALLFTRSKPVETVEKYDFTKHPAYPEVKSYLSNASASTPAPDFTSSNEWEDDDLPF